MNVPYFTISAFLENAKTLLECFDVSAMMAINSMDLVEIVRTLTSAKVLNHASTENVLIIKAAIDVFVQTAMNW